MPSFFPRRFTDVEFLKSISPGNLFDFLSPFNEELFELGLELGKNRNMPLDYEQLIHLLVNADPRIPKGLVDAIYYVHEMSTPDGMNALLGGAPHLLKFTGGEPTPGDVAIVAWLQNRPLLEEKLSERFLERTKSFVYYQGSATAAKKSISLSDPNKAAIEADFDTWFQSKRRGRGAKIFLHPRGNEVWFLVRHGDPMRRDGTYDNGKSDSVYYRPEKYDVLIYYLDLDRLAVHASTQGEKTLYRESLGKYLFGGKDYFTSSITYTLTPLQVSGEASLNCFGVEGMKWIRLKDIEIDHGSFTLTYKAKGSDLFAALGRAAAGVLQSGDPLRAKFRCDSPIALHGECSTFGHRRTPVIRGIRIACCWRPGCWTKVSC